MGKHTKEPWSFDKYQNIIADSDTLLLGGICTPMTSGPRMKEGKANARRIVACVNALQGVSTEDLEEAVSLGIKDVRIGNLFSSRMALQRQLSDVTSQRDELLAALEEGRRAIGEHFAPNDCYSTGPMTGDEFRDLVQCPACSFIAMYDEVMAKVKGGAS